MNHNTNALITAVIQPYIEEKLDYLKLKPEWIDSQQVIYKTPDSKMKVDITKCSFTGYRVIVNNIETGFNVPIEKIKDLIK